MTPRKTLRIAGLAVLLAAASGVAPAYSQGFVGLDHDHDPVACGTVHLGGPDAAGMEALRASLRTHKASSPPDVGDRQEFSTWQYSSSSWVLRRFELRDKTDQYHAWVEVANLAQMTDSELTAIQDALIHATPAGSIDPAAGVLANNHAVFGQPPNLDGDGVLDLLFYDIDNQNVGGFVHPGDLTEGTGGNERDVLHLDIFQSISYMPRLIAHEYVHLIHFNYDGDLETFVQEGMAEYSWVVNGYTVGSFTYLGFPSEHGRGLFSWRGVDSPTGGRDYDRGRLFFSYVGDRVGPFRTGEIIRMERKGAPGVDSVLAQDGLSLSEVITDFHTANWVFDRDVDPAFGYLRPFVSVPTVLAGQHWDTQGEMFTPEANESDRPTVEGGGTRYEHFGELARLRVEFDAFATQVSQDLIPGILDDVRSRLRGRLVGTREDGVVVWADLHPLPAVVTLEGNYTEVRLVAVSADASKQVRYAMDASWQAFGTATTVTRADLPDTFGIDGIYPNPATDRATVAWSQAATGPTQVRLVDVLGRTVRLVQLGVFGPGPHQATVVTSGLPAGTYLLSLEKRESHDTGLITVLGR